MTTTPAKTIAFFGATGGCALACLTRTLLSESPVYHVNALARTPSKLTNLLKERGVPSEIVDSRLTIISGDVKNAEAVRSTLVTKSERMADIIVCGIGGTPQLRLHPYPVTLNDPTICEDATNTIIAQVSSLTSSGVKPVNGRPYMAIVSTTGISKRRRDVPYAFVPLYHWFLAVPHEDKRKVETNLAKNIGNLNFTAVRPSLLMDGPAKSMDAVRVGWELPEGPGGDDQSPGPAIGYTITRDTVGQWMFENLVKGNAEEWGGKMVSLTE